MDRYFWRHKSFPIDFEGKKAEMMKWICPNCDEGKLQLDRKQFTVEETEESKKLRILNDERPPEEDEYIFCGILRCQNCKHQVSFLGCASYEEGIYYSNSTDEELHYPSLSLEPKHFFPPLKLIEIPQKCPDKVKSEIEKAFSSYWSDYESSANKIRIAVELLMDHLKVKKWHKPAGKTKEVKHNLHHRIELFRQKNETVGKHLMAIKVIANEGSHAGEIKMDDVLDGFELLELSLEKLFNNNQERLEKITDKIVKRNKPRSK